MRQRLLSAQFGLFLIMALLLSSVQSVVFDHGFYTDLYDRIQLSQSTGVSRDDLHKAIFMMTDYVEGKREDLNGTIVRNGRKVSVFNEKEITHMKEVRTLYRQAHAVMVFSWIAALLAAGVILWKKKAAGLQDLFSGFVSALCTLCILLLILGFWCLSDFNGFWFWFHTVVFPGSSDWLLNPATDFMIVICPEQMFSTMILQISLRLAGAASVCAAVLAVLAKGADRLSELPHERRSSCQS